MRAPEQRPPQRFFYHRSVAPLMWMLIVVMTGELAVDHFLLWLWSPTAAAVVSAISVAALAWLIRAVLAMRRMPVELGDEMLTMRVGTIRRVDVPIGQVAGLRASWDGEAIKHRSVRNLALIAYPNVVVDLTEPLPGRRCVRAIAHRLDDPAGFEAALTAQLITERSGAASP